MSSCEDWVSRPAGPLHGEILVPGDKSISHRALMLGALAEGTTRIDGFLEGDDTCATAAILAAMGVDIDAPGASCRIINGVGLRGLAMPDHPLDCGNSGTGMRLLAGLLAGQMFDSTLVGDASLSRRPMRRVVEPLRAMGADIVASATDLPPLRIRGGQTLVGIDYVAPVASAQVKSALLLAGMYANGETCISEAHPTRDHTERMLAAFGWPITYAAGHARLLGRHRLCATRLAVPGDFSSAAFFLVAASVTPGSDLLLRAVGMNPRRTGLLDVLACMGADIDIENRREQSGEPIADLRVRHTQLSGIEVAEDRTADLIDEFPILFIAAAAAHGRTLVRGAGELRVKESDRIAVMCDGLRSLGVEAIETADGAIIEGGALTGGTVDSAGDHRCTMSFAVAGLIAQAPLRVNDCANVATSFPGFVDLANASGFDLVVCRE
ncbi:MAG: 3-phosphoshikimate 1-carboxyvinyltransferase [Rhodanobacteraceae bacterium]